MTDSRLRLATWNIHMAIGRDRQRNLPRTATVIRLLNADVIGLQEVDNQIGRGDEDDLCKLSALTGFEVIAGPTMTRHRGDYGNALLTRLPVRKVERFDLSYRRREPRGLLLVQLDWENEVLLVAITHLGLHPAERRDQVRRLCDILAHKKKNSLILMGDFNEWLIWGRPLRWLRRRFGKMRSPPTFPSIWPFLQLDHILADPSHRLVRKQVVHTPLARQASDHLPLVAEWVCQS